MLYICKIKLMLFPVKVEAKLCLRSLKHAFCFAGDLKEEAECIQALFLFASGHPMHFTDGII